MSRLRSLWSERQHHARQWIRWLYPGMGVKRWLALVCLGVTFLGLGFAYVLVNIYREAPLPPVFYYITLQFIPRLGRAALFGLLGIVLVVGGIWGLNRSLLSAVMPARSDGITELVYRRRIGRRGPRIVAIGGGTGLSTLLRGLKNHTSNITAIVTVADDGGSSGRLRQGLGVLPPGDFRQCIAALAEVEPLMTQLFEYRFPHGTGLDGHSFGNLFIAAMTGISGDFVDALRQSSRVLAVRGRVIPSTLRQVTLCAELENETVVYGESKVPKGDAAIRRVFLTPDDPPAYPEAIQAILEADLVVIGPGSLYTSVMPNLLVPGIVQALRASQALKVYVCNVASQPGETDGYQLLDYLRALERHVGPGPLVDVVLANDNLQPVLPAAWRVHLVHPEGGQAEQGWRLVTADLIDEERPTRHHPEKLAARLLQLLSEADRSHHAA